MCGLWSWVSTVYWKAAPSGVPLTHNVWPLIMSKYGLWIHRPLEWWFICLFGPKTKKTPPMLWVTDPFCWDSTMDFPHKGPLIMNLVPCRDVIIFLFSVCWPMPGRTAAVGCTWTSTLSWRRGRTWSIIARFHVTWWTRSATTVLGKMVSMS